MVDAPGHIVFVPEMETVGSGFTVTIFDSLSVHPFASVPTTVYVVVDDGETEILDVVPRLLPQTYEVAPDAVNVVVAPLQMVVVPEIDVVTTIGVPEIAKVFESPVVVIEMFPEIVDAVADILMYTVVEPKVPEVPDKVNVLE